MAAIGIDLGTTNCCMAFVKPDGTKEVIINGRGDRTTPSAIAFVEKNIYYGVDALDSMSRYPNHVIHGLKYLIGRNFSDYTVQKQLDKVGYAISSKKDNVFIGITDENKSIQYYLPEELSGLLLKELKKYAEIYLGKQVEKAVITVPTYFDDRARQATIDAGKIAGFEVVELLNEPTAAALAYGEKLNNMKTILVFDLGGGTFDISVLVLNKDECNVLAIDGDLNLGGDDIDNNMIDYVSTHLDKKNIKLRNKRIRLKILCEKVKKDLSVRQKAGLEIAEFDEFIDFSRVHFNELNRSIFDKCMNVLNGSLKRINLNKEHIDNVLLVGGSTRNCYIRERLEEYFPGKIKSDTNPDEAVAIGAAIKASSLTRQHVKATKINQLSAHSFGISLTNGAFASVIPKYSPIPISKERRFRTYDKNFSSVLIEIYKGESDNVKNNILIEKFQVDNIRSDRDGLRRLTITFDLDSNGILKVTANDNKGLNEHLNITLERGNLTTTEVNESTKKIDNLYKN